MSANSPWCILSTSAPQGTDRCEAHDLNAGNSNPAKPTIEKKVARSHSFNASNKRRFLHLRLQETPQVKFGFSGDEIEPSPS